MFSLHLAQKKEKETLFKKKSQKKQQNWLKKYHSQVKPRLLERYDARVNAFIRQVEQAPEDKSKILTHHQSTNFRPLKFTNASQKELSLKKKEQINASLGSIGPGILRSSDYVPLSSYQYRERQKEKEIKPNIQMKILKYRKWQKESQLIGSIINNKNKEDGQLSKLSARQFFRRIPEDNRSQIPSMYDDNQSLRFSVNDNIEGQARQYQKNQELIQKKQHFKRLANLQQVVKDQRAKKSIHQLLVKGGFTKPKIKIEGQEAQVDQLKLQMQKHFKL